MIPEGDLREIVRSQIKNLGLYEFGVEREKGRRVEMELPHALIISGIRRCGKSTFLHQLSERFPHFHYLNFEDPRLSNFKINDFEKLDEIFLEEYGDYRLYLFDEIQAVEKWELFVRSRLDNKKKFIITGANSSLLSKELGTKLTGRHVNLELFPFSFREFLLLKRREGGINAFRDYLKDGGFPEYLKYGKADILQQLFIDVVQRDIVARHKLRESKILEQMALYLITNVGKEFSYNNLKEIFNLGSVSTVTSYISYFEDSYLLFSVTKFDFSLKKQLVNQKKMYCIDNGLSSVNSVSFSLDAGRMLENAVFLHLRRNHKNIFYFKGKNECDFILRERDKIVNAVQVCYNLNSENREREFDGLVEVLDKFGLESGLMLTYDQEDNFKMGKKKIIVKPAWKWMMEK